MAFWRFVALALATICIVPAVHALRRRTSLVHTYALIAFMAFAGWVTPHGAAVSVGGLSLGVASTVFFGAVLGGVFLLYVADGPRAGKMGVSVVVGIGVLYSLLAAMMKALTRGPGDWTGLLLPFDSLRAGAASIVASFTALVLLGVVWEWAQKPPARRPLFLRVLLTLVTVLAGDTLVYVPLAWAGEPGFTGTLGGSLVARLVLALLYAPVFTLYLQREVRRHGLTFTARPALSIVAKEDLERELLSARHNLRLGTEALWVSEEQYRRMVDDIPLLVFRFSREGVVTYANRALCDHYRRPLDAVLGTNVLLPVDREERDRVWSCVLALTPADPTVELTVHTFPAEGERRVERWVVRGVFSPHGTGVAYQAIGEDVTRELELEAALAHARRMDAVAQLAGGVAHDFNNLLTVVRASTENAQETLAREAPGAFPGVREALGDIRQTAERAASLTRQLRAISRQGQVQPQRISLTRLVEELAPLVRRLLPESIRLELACEPQVPLALVDPSQLERVVMNLVINARDAMPQGGVLRVSTSSTSLDAEALRGFPGSRAGRYVVLTVRDTGLGMDEAVLRRIFEPFFTTRSASGGTGLGLSTVHGIARQAGGHVRVVSSPGAGSTFQVYLPAREDAAGAPPPVGPAP